MAKAKAKKAKLVTAEELAESILITLGLSADCNEYFDEDLENVTELIGGFIETHGIS